MIDLTPWFDPEELREHIRSPFNYSGKTVATNGHIMICVDERPEFDALAKESIHGTIKRVINTECQFAKLDSSITAPNLESCNNCNGTGRQAKVDCLECDGTGEVEWDSGYHTYEMECQGCDGIGTTQEEGQCECCTGTGKTFPKDSAVIVDGVPIQPKYFNLLKTLSPDAEVFGDKEMLWLRFKNHECIGVIMGYRV